MALLTTNSSCSYTAKNNQGGPEQGPPLFLGVLYEVPIIEVETEPELFSVSRPPQGMNDSDVFLLYRQNRLLPYYVRRFAHSGEAASGALTNQSPPKGPDCFLPVRPHRSIGLAR